MAKEFTALEENITWTVMTLPLGRKPIDCKCVYKVKHNADGSVQRYKARLVAKGFTEVEGLDYRETFAPVARIDLNEEVYMKLPPGFHATHADSLKFFLGVEVARSLGLFLCQRRRALDIIGLLGFKPADIPMEFGHNLQLVEELADGGVYRRLVGRLGTEEALLEAALQVVHYLKGGLGQRILLCADSELCLRNSDWASCLITRKSVTRYFVTLGHSPISWKTKAPSQSHPQKRNIGPWL
ncbi:retrovirus-related pol polyprotein from transposon RE1 [Tanacetum coccineum]